MTWLQTLFVGVLTAAFSALLSGIVASLSMDWHQVSSFEGRSDYYAMFIALAGLLGGLVLGTITARVVAAGADPSFGRGLTYALLIVMGAASLVAGVARWMADVPPTLRGQQLMLLVEVRWPKTQRISPAVGSVARVLELGALSGGTLRRSKQGPLWMEDARLEEGHWIVPGAVEVATNRGQRIVTVEPKIPGAHGLLLPMNGSPSAKHLDWSEWMPRARPGEAAIADQFSFRYKVVPRNEPSRTEAVGSFQVGTIAKHFFVDGWSTGQPVVEAKAQFVVWYQGQAGDH